MSRQVDEKWADLALGTVGSTGPKLLTINSKQNHIKLLVTISGTLTLVVRRAPRAGRASAGGAT